MVQRLNSMVRGMAALLLAAACLLLLAACGDDATTPIGGDGAPGGGDNLRPPATQAPQPPPAAGTDTLATQPPGGSGAPATGGQGGVSSATSDGPTGAGSGLPSDPQGSGVSPTPSAAPPSVDPCTPPLRLCDGFCTNVQSSNQHCGACDSPCVGGQSCEGGSCRCPVGETFCPEEERCVDLVNDPENCGGCGLACGSSEVCEEGECGCGGGLFICEEECVDRQSDVRHCGACNSGCKPDEGCYEGECALCPPGQEFCDEACVDVRTSDVHCGACDNACGTDESCRNGSCGCPGDHLLGNQSQATAWRIPFGDVDLPAGRSGGFSDLFRCPGESDWFRVDVPGNGATIRVDVGRNCGPGSQPRLTIHSGGAQNIFVGGGADNCTRATRDLSAGTHWLEVSGNVGDEFVYDLRWSFEHTTQDGTAYNTRGSARGPKHRPFEVRARLDAGLGNPADYYRLDLNFAGVFNFETTMCGTEAFLRLEDASGGVIAEGARSFNCGTLQTPLSPGRYYLRVAPERSGEWGSYRVRMSGQPVRAQRPQITPGTATDLGFLPTAGEGALRAGVVDPDHWRIRLSTASDLVVETRGLVEDCEVGTVVEVRSGDGSTLIAAGSGGGAASPRGGSCTRLAAADLPALRNLAAGDYLVTVRGEGGAVGPYLVSAWAE